LRQGGVLVRRRYVTDWTDWARVVKHELTARGILVDKESRRQRIVIAETKRFGEMLLLGNKAARGKPKPPLSPQFAMGDEYRYHEMLVYLPLLYHDAPSEMVIGGGGDLLAAWRGTHCYGVQRISVLDWDLNVQRLVREHIPAVERLGVHRNPKVHADKEADMRAYLKRSTPPVPVFIWDLIDMESVEGFMPNTLELIYKKLLPGAVGIFQGREYAHDSEPLAQIIRNFRSLKEWFTTVLLVQVPVGSFNYRECLYLVSKERVLKPHTPRPEELAERFDLSQRRYFFPRTHDAALMLDPEIEAALMMHGLL
jgi:spermidine synthase